MSEPSIARFLELESAVWEALVRGDAAADRDLLTDDFLGVYPTGFAVRDDHSDQLADGPTVDSFEILDPRLLIVGPTAVMLSYRAEYRRPGTDLDDQAEVMFVSSLWCERDGRWRNVFSQDTPSQPDLRLP